MTDETQGEGQAPVEDTSLASQTEGEGADTQEEETGDDPAAEAQPEEQPEDQPERPKVTARERINELTKARREAEREAQYWREQAQKAQPPQQAQAEDGEPNPDDYEHGENDVAYIEDRAAYRAVKAVEEREAKRRSQEAIQTKLAGFEAKAEELYPEGDPEGLEAFKANPRIRPEAQELVIESDIGPKLADYLGSRPRELARISALPLAKQAREITLIEQRLSAGSIAPKAPPRTATSAPEPAPQLRGNGGRFKPPPDTDDFAAFEKNY